MLIILMLALLMHTIGIHVLTCITITKNRTFNPSLKTFTILLDTVWFFTITTFCMFCLLNFFCKAILVLIHSLANSLVSFFLIVRIILTVFTFTVFIAHLTCSKAVAIGFKTFRFHALTSNRFDFWSLFFWFILLTGI